MLAPEVKMTLKEINDYIQSKGALGAGNLIIAIHVLYMDTKMLDVEMIVPINKPVASAENFNFLPVFEIKNCVMAHFEGTPYLLPNFYTEMHRWTENNGLKIKQPFYIVFTKEPDEIWGCDSIEADIYVNTH